jgi:uncharacterized membrane protein
MTKQKPSELDELIEKKKARAARVTVASTGAKKDPAKDIKVSALAKSEKVAEKLDGLAEETRLNVSRIIEIENTQRAGLTRGERLSEFIAGFCGSMAFVWVHVFWFGMWIVINAVFKNLAFDPFPYTFLTLVVSLEAIFLSTFILISQNHETELSERRNHLDLQINLLTEQENTKILEMLSKIAEKVGINVDDPVVDKMLEDMDPEMLVNQIMAVKGEEVAEEVAAQVTGQLNKRREGAKSEEKA